MIIFLVVIVIIVAVGGMYAINGGKQREQVSSSIDSKPTIKYTPKQSSSNTKDDPAQMEKKTPSPPSPETPPIAKGILTNSNTDIETKEQNQEDDDVVQEEKRDLVEIYRNTPIMFDPVPRT
jgi:hypothetical protein